MTEEVLKAILAHMHALLVVQVARERFGKALFDLSPDEDKQAQQIAYGMVKYCYALMGSEALAGLKSSDVSPDKLQ